MNKTCPNAKDWSPEDLALLVQSEVLIITDPGRAIQISTHLKAKEELQVIYYCRFAGRWQCKGPISFAKYMQMVNEELKKMHGNRQFTHSDYAYHPPNYQTLDAFDTFMIAQYGGTIPPIDPADMNDDLLKLFDGL